MNKTETLLYYEVVKKLQYLSDKVIGIETNCRYIGTHFNSEMSRIFVKYDKKEKKFIEFSYFVFEDGINKPEYVEISLDLLDFKKHTQKQQIKKYK